MAAVIPTDTRFLCHLSSEVFDASAYPLNFDGVFRIYQDDRIAACFSSINNLGSRLAIVYNTGRGQGFPIACEV